MSAQTAFQSGLQPWLQLLLPGREDQLLAVEGNPVLRERIEILAGKSTEGELTEEERAEYEGYVRANKFAAVLRRQAMLMAAGK
jgi:hypothetical protein